MPIPKLPVKDSEATYANTNNVAEFDPVLQILKYSQQTLESQKFKAIEVVKSSNPSKETGIYRSPLFTEELAKDFPQIKTVYDMFNNTVKFHGEKPAFGTRIPSYAPGGGGGLVWSDFVWKTYAQANVDRLNFGAGLVTAYEKYVPTKSANGQWFLGIFSINRYEWVISDLGASCYSIPNVALYDTLGPETSEYIINHSELPIIVTTVDKVSSLLQMSSRCPTLKVIIVMESLLKEQESPIPILQKWGNQLGVTVLSFSQVLEMGKKNPVPHKPPTATDIYALSYTSGTTGDPKGAILLHVNMISTLRSALGMPVVPGDCHISYLPLAHIFEKCNMALLLINGAQVGFFRGDVSLLIEDIGVLKPTVFVSVPRLFNRIYDKIMNGALNSGSALKAALFTRAVEAKLHHLHNGGHLTHSLWDPLVFNKVKAVLGGRVRLMVTGSAPLAGNVMNFLRIATGAQFIEGYGQTESNAALTISWPNDFKLGHCGYIVPSMELKLVSVPEMSYNAKDLKGEVWVRGNGVFRGYLKDPKKTEETITPDGWLQTGDIGTLDKVGRLSIVDRKKNIFKLAQGEYVAPEKLEGTFLKSNLVAQIYVHGDSLQSELVGIVVPDEENAIRYGIQHGILPADTVAPPPPAPNAPLHPLVLQLAKSDKFIKAVLDDLTVVGKQDKLRGFEFLKAIHIHGELFSAENGLLTPTFKMKRPEAAKVFRPQIDKMYSTLNANAAPSKL